MERQGQVECGQGVKRVW